MVQTRKCLLTIPVYGKIEFTHALIGDLAPQTDPENLLVVDNKGDYRAIAGERVVRLTGNQGWAKASNIGFRTGFSEGYTHATTLNNDTRVSPQFVAGLLDPRIPDDAGIIGPLYDDSYRQQRSDYDGPAADFQSSPHYRSAKSIDGTALTMTRDAWIAVGDLDVRSFGFYAWGADLDLCARVREAGFGVYVTEMAYLNHIGRVTATDASLAGKQYFSHAWRGMRGGVRSIYGRDWKTKLGSPVAPTTWCRHQMIG